MPPTFLIFVKRNEVLIVVTLINKKSVYTQLLKGHCIILFGLVVELIELLLDRFLCALQLFYRRSYLHGSFSIP